MRHSGSVLNFEGVAARRQQLLDKNITHDAINQQIATRPPASQQLLDKHINYDASGQQFCDNHLPAKNGWATTSLVTLSANDSRQ